MKTKRLVILAILFLAALLFSQKDNYENKDRIKFSHKFHQVEVETTCADCHAGAETSKLAADKLMPDKETCETCHDVSDEETCSLCHYEDEETYQQLTVAKSDLIFNHEFHKEQGLACESCHKNLDKVDYADAGSIAEMTDCTQCHNNQQATLECASCHQNTLNLRPNDHLPDYLISHRNIARVDDEACATCHVENDCMECHDGSAVFSTVVSGGVKDSQTPFFPSLAGGTKGLVLSRVHELNFRLTHGLQAVGRSQECVVCHDTQDFCQTCHETEGVDVAGKPIWHGGPDWGAFAGVVGTGGGRHAELAKQDIENCAACHSPEGDDPTCLLCPARA